jgi:hypothetical protein
LFNVQIEWVTLIIIRKIAQHEIFFRSRHWLNMQLCEPAKPIKFKIHSDGLILPSGGVNLPSQPSEKMLAIVRGEF